MNYSDNLDFILKKELSKLIDMKKNNEYPFDKSTVSDYYDKYLQLQRKLNDNFEKK